VGNPRRGASPAELGRIGRLDPDAVLKDRFGARLLRVGFGDFSVLASWPRSKAHAERIAAEHYAFCDECAGRGLSDVRRIAEHLLTRTDLDLLVGLT
jgi:Domain of unknown function (DUF4253)